MLIRSQDKEKLTDDMNLYIDDWETENHFSICNSKMDMLGVYSTKEKAIGVLDDIYQAHRNLQFTDGITYQMPQDSEV